ncbi:MAG: selenoprotein B, partial [Desulfobacteraceae bacterium]|nr:selenoprotein B [Desulfobacteraceae bacterium]
MGGLAHYLEEEGLSTTQISLIKPHTETIKPPRALWVSFDMGRPFGEANDAEFQTRVLTAAFKLLDEKEVPVLEDFPEDASYMTEDGPWACPVNLEPLDEDLSEEEKLISAFKSEMNQMRNWYDLALEKRGRTTVGVSGVDLEDLADFISAFLSGPFPENPNPDFRLPHTLNLATDDLKAFYMEAITAQPGPTGTPDQLADWFYGQTAAGKLL